MVVDSRASVAAGRALWALPKRFAKIDLSSRGERATVQVEVEDGARLSFETRGHAPIARRSDRIVTLQAREREIVRFRGTSAGDSGAVAPAWARCRCTQNAWEGVPATLKALPESAQDNARPTVSDASANTTLVGSAQPEHETTQEAAVAGTRVCPAAAEAATAAIDASLALLRSGAPDAASTVLSVVRALLARRRS